MYLTVNPQPIISKSYSKEEDDFIFASRQRSPPVTFGKISAVLRRTEKSVRNRYRYHLLRGDTTGSTSKPFTKNEDAYIIDCRLQNPPLTFGEISLNLQRNEKSVHNRYCIIKDDPNSNARRPFTKEEDDFLISARQRIPPLSFREIGKRLKRQDRTVNSRYRLHLREKNGFDGSEDLDDYEDVDEYCKEYDSNDDDDVENNEDDGNGNEKDARDPSSTILESFYAPTAVKQRRRFFY